MRCLAYYTINMNPKIKQWMIWHMVLMTLYQPGTAMDNYRHCPKILNWHFLLPISVPEYVLHFSINNLFPDNDKTLKSPRLHDTWTLKV